MSKSTAYPYQSKKIVRTKKQLIHEQINVLIVENFSLFDGFTNAETVWLAMKGNGIKLSISSFYNRLKDLVDANIIEKQQNGYNRFVYIATKLKSSNE